MARESLPVWSQAALHSSFNDTPRFCSKPLSNKLGIKYNRHTHTEKTSRCILLAIEIALSQSCKSGTQAFPPPRRDCWSYLSDYVLKCWLPLLFNFFTYFLNHKLFQDSDKRGRSNYEPFKKRQDLMQARPNDPLPSRYWTYRSVGMYHHQIYSFSLCYIPSISYFNNWVCAVVLNDCNALL